MQLAGLQAPGSSPGRAAAVCLRQGPRRKQPSFAQLRLATALAAILPDQQSRPRGAGLLWLITCCMHSSLGAIDDVLRLAAAD